MGKKIAADNPSCSVSSPDRRRWRNCSAFGAAVGGGAEVVAAMCANRSDGIRRLRSDLAKNKMCKHSHTNGHKEPYWNSDHRAIWTDGCGRCVDKQPEWKTDQYSQSEERAPPVAWASESGHQKGYQYGHSGSVYDHVRHQDVNPRVRLYIANECLSQISSRFLDFSNVLGWPGSHY